MDRCKTRGVGVWARMGKEREIGIWKSLHWEIGDRKKKTSGWRKKKVGKREKGERQRRKILPALSSFFQKMCKAKLHIFLANHLVYMIFRIAKAYNLSVTPMLFFG